MYESPAELQSIQTPLCAHYQHTARQSTKKILMFLLNYESEWGSLGERETLVLWENEVRYQICFHNTV